MDELSLLIAEEIKKQYKSIGNFAKKANIPLTTISGALKKGIGKSSFNNVIKICSLLKIREIIYEVPMDESNTKDVGKYLLLDESGRNRVRALIELEKSRLS